MAPRSPEAKERKRLYDAARLAGSPELRAANRARARAYNKTPEGRAKAAALRATPKWRKRERETWRKYSVTEKAKRLRFSGHLRRKFGITPEEYDAMLAAQRGLCKICGDVPHGKRRGHVDHSHVTGKVRGILCCACNRLLGAAKDDPERLRRAIHYLENAP
jgi:hypothetical protein